MIREATILSSLPASVFVFDLATRVVTYCNPAFSAALGHSQPTPEMLHPGVGTEIHPDDFRSSLLDHHLGRFTVEHPLHFECRLRHADGSWRWFGMRLVGFNTDEMGRPLAVLGVAAEITEFKQAEDRLRHEATHDELTGLWNRRQFLEELDASIAEPGLGLVLCSCDIDEFKSINDQHGHARGDDALRCFAHLLRSSVRKDDVVARFGGDEFAVLFRRVSQQECRAAVERVRASFAGAVMRAGEVEFSATASFGLAEFQPGMSAQELLDAADQALYRAKRSGRNQLCE